jgi:hypothetical protein
MYLRKQTSKLSHQLTELAEQRNAAASMVWSSALALKQVTLSRADINSLL